MNLPPDLKYTATHEWARLEPDGSIRVGITDHAQEMLGDMVFVELPRPGQKVAQGAECAVVESVKAAADIYAPVSGEVTEVNTSLPGAPQSINQDPYAAWLFRLKPDDSAALGELLDADAYARLAAEQES